MKELLLLLGNVGQPNLHLHSAAIRHYRLISNANLSAIMGQLVTKAIDAGCFRVPPNEPYI